jgi:osmotically-inducible protein OsmY
MNRERMATHQPKKLLALLTGAALAAAVLAGCAGAGVKSGQYVDDSAITTKVRTELLKTSNLKTTGIHITTIQGEVQLSGHVPSETDKQRAEVVARDVGGVRAVSNRIEVKAD